MRVGLMGDTHDRLPAIASLLEKIREKGVSIVMHAGDYCSPFALAPFHDASIPLLGIFGRNDGDQESLKAYAALGVGTELYESPHSFDVGGHRILLVHDLVEVNKRSISSHEFVFHACTHRAEVATRGDTLLVNPGEACGWLHGECTAAIVDLDTKEVEKITL
jgi:putative phosphoesterase